MTRFNYDRLFAANAPIACAGPCHKRKSNTLTARQRAHCLNPHHPLFIISATGQDRVASHRKRIGWQRAGGLCRFW